MKTDDKEIEALNARHARVIGAAVGRVCRDRYASLAPDATQEVHIALWKALESGKKIERPSSYIYKVALTTGLAMVEKAKKQWLIARDLHEDAPRAHDDRRAERARLIDELLATLRADQADALRAYLAGFNHVDIARLFGWSESAARHRVYRSIEKLRAFMREHSATSEVPERERS